MSDFLKFWPNIFIFEVSHRPLELDINPHVGILSPNQFRGKWLKNMLFRFLFYPVKFIIMIFLRFFQLITRKYFHNLGGYVAYLVMVQKSLISLSIWGRSYWVGGVWGVLYEFDFVRTQVFSSIWYTYLYADVVNYRNAFLNFIESRYQLSERFSAKI